MPFEDEATCVWVSGWCPRGYDVQRSGITEDDFATWCKAIKPAAPIGVFFENVQPLTGAFELGS